MNIKNFVGLLLLTVAIVFGDEKTCSVDEAAAAIKSESKRQAVVITGYSIKDKTSVGFNFTLGSTVDRYPANNVAIFLVPQGSLQVADFSSQQLDGIGGAVLLKSGLPTLGKIGFDDPVKLSQAYFVFSAGYACDFERERKNGLLTWTILRGPLGYPMRFSLRDPKDPLMVSAYAVTKDGEKKGSLVHIYGNKTDWPADLNLWQSGFKSNVVGVGWATPVGHIRDYLALAESNPSQFLRSKWCDESACHFVGFFDNDNNENNPAQFIIESIGKKYSKKGTESFRSWIDLYQNRLSAILEEQGEIATFDWKFSGALALGGAWLDKGIGVEKNVRSIISSTGTLTSLGFADLLISANSSEAAIDYAVTFPEDQDNGVFEEGFTRVDFAGRLFKDVDQMQNPVNNGRFYLEWSDNIEPWLIDAGSGKLVRMNDCDEEGCFGIPDAFEESDLNYRQLSARELGSLMVNGLWVKSIPEALSSAPSGTLRFGRMDGGTPDKYLDAELYLDSRLLVARPDVQIRYTQKQGEIDPVKEKSVVGYSYATNMTIPFQFNQSLRVAKTGLQSTGTPRIQLTPGVLEGAQSEGISIEARTDPWTTHVIADGGPLEEEKLYTSALTVYNSKNQRRIIAPFNFWGTWYQSNILVAGSSQDAITRYHRAIAKSYADYLYQQKHLYTEWADLSQWRLGSVYFQVKGVSALTASQMELSQVLSSYPNFTTEELNVTPAATPQAPAPTKGLVYFLGGADPNNLTPAQKAEIESYSAGKVLDSKKFDSPAEMAAAGIENADLSLLDGVPDAFMGLMQPEFVCYTQKKTPGLSCMTPKGVREVAPIILEEIQRGLMAYASGGASAALTDWQDVKWDLETGHYMRAMISALPGTFDKAFRAYKKVAKNKGFQRAVISNAARLSEGVEEVAQRARRAPSSVITEGRTIHSVRDAIHMDGPKKGVIEVLEPDGIRSAEGYIKEADKFQERIAPSQKIIADNGRAYRAVPALRIEPDKIPGGIATHPFVKFDGIQKGDDGVLELIDAKWVTRPGSIVRRRKSTNQLKRALHAAEQNSTNAETVRIVYHFSDKKSADAYRKYLKQLGDEDAKTQSLINSFLKVRPE